MSLLNRKILAAVVLLLLCLLAFWEVRNCQFVNLDDDTYVTDNPPVEQGLTLPGFAWAFTTTHGANWHPLTWLSHMLDCQLFGLQPGRHHVVNLLFHLANTLLLFFWLQRLTGALLPSFLAAGLFAVHPLHVESVAWVAERKDVLSTFFWLLTLWAYLGYVERPGGQRYLWVVLCFALGLMAKPMLVTLPLVLLLLDYWPLGRLALPGGQPAAPPTVSNREPLSLKRLAWEKAPLLGLSVASCLVTFYAQRAGGAMETLEAIPLGARLANAAVSYVVYLGKALWPAHLVVFYQHPRTILPWWQIGGALLILGLLSALAVWQARRRPYLLVGWLWYLGTLVPVIGLVQVGGQAMADRYTYVPLIGIFIGAAWGLADLAARWRLPSWFYPLATGAVLSVLTLCTANQVRHWHDSITLFEHALTVSADIPMVHNNLGNALFLSGRQEEALTHYQEALRLQPAYPEAHNNLGVALAHLGHPDQAIQHYVEALRLWPAYPTAHYNLGDILYKLGRYGEAANQYRIAWKLRPGYSQAVFNLGNVLFIQGKVADAIFFYREALRLQPGYAEAHNNLGVALVTLGHPEQALQHYGEALRLRPAYVDAHYNLGRALLLTGRVDEAVGQFKQVLALNQDYWQALNSLAQIWATAPEERLRNGAAAIALAERANRLSGNKNPQVLDTLAAAYAEAGRFPQALETAQKASQLARDAGQAELAREIDSRMALYRTGHPWRQVVGKKAPAAGGQKP
jgi:tetratricopeptide (TPR) repeat protein